MGGLDCRVTPNGLAAQALQIERHTVQDILDFKVAEGRVGLLCHDGSIA